MMIDHRKHLLTLFLFLIGITLTIFTYGTWIVESSMMINQLLGGTSGDSGTIASRLKLNPSTGAFELNGKPIVWQYWDSDTPPLYNRLLVEAFQCRNLEFELIQVHESDFFDYLPEFGGNMSRDVFRLLYAAHQADVFRTHVLVKYGGVFMDNDAFPLDKLYPQYERLRDYDVFIGDCGNANGTYNFNFAGMGPSRANAGVLRIWADEQIRTMQKYFVDDLVLNKTTKDPFGWMDLLYRTEKRVEAEMFDEETSNRTVVGRYHCRQTCYQLIDRIGVHSAHYGWSNESSKLLPFGWSPFLFLWGEKIREMFTPLNSTLDLFPEEETVYSVLVGCALLDCRGDYERSKKAGIAKIRSTDLNINDLLDVLERVNRTICRSIRNDTNDMDYAFEKLLVKRRWLDG